MSDNETKPPMPKQPTTVALEAPPPWAISLTEKVVTGFSVVEKRLDTIEANVELQGGHMQEQGKRMTLFDERLSRLEDRSRNESVRAKALSDVDSQHDAAIANLTTEVAEVKDAVLATRKAVTGFLSNPKVLAAGRIVFLLLAAYAAGKGIKVLP